MEQFVGSKSKSQQNQSMRNISKIQTSIKRACPSRSVNAWKVVLSGKGYIITPAHVAMFPDRKTNNYIKSTFLQTLGKELIWNVPRLYTPNAFGFDFAWAKLKSDEDCVRSQIIESASFQDVDLFFQSPYDAAGVWNDTTSELGYVSAGMYPSPRSQLYEALDVGYKGMSGALVTTATEDDTPLVAGMLLRRGGPIPLKVKPPIRFDPSLVTSTDSKVLMTAMQMLADTMLTKSDVEALNNVTAMRRSLIMPVARMIELMDDSVLLDSVVGKPATAMEVYDEN